LLEAAFAQPLQTFVDGNKCIGHAAMQLAMILNGLGVCGKTS
jgi:prophage maintenance system killer protein